MRWYSRLIFDSIEMATSLGIWTLLIILYQTIICLVISWVTLECRLSPKSTELREVTLMKLLYLYDPEACGRVHFYNFTLDGQQQFTYTNIMWPVRNKVASRVRRKLQIWLALHIIWLFLSIVNITQSERSCGYYMTLFPFTLSGIAILIVDAVFMAMFLEDTKYTNNELGILRYISDNSRDLRWIHDTITLQEIPAGTLEKDDTTWISLMFAYGSCRGVVQWIINFWIVKDNYFEGLAVYRRQQMEQSKLLR